MDNETSIENKLEVLKKRYEGKGYAYKPVRIAGQTVEVALQIREVRLNNTGEFIHFVFVQSSHMDNKHVINGFKKIKERIKKEVHNYFNIWIIWIRQTSK